MCDQAAGNRKKQAGAANCHLLPCLARLFALRVEKVDTGSQDHVVLAVLLHRLREIPHRVPRLLQYRNHERMFALRDINRGLLNRIGGRFAGFFGC